MSAVQAGGAAFQLHHRLGVAVAAQLGAGREAFAGLQRRGALAGFPGGAALGQVALLRLVRLSVLQHADGDQVALQHGADLGDDGRHVHAALLQVADARVEHRLELLDQEGAVAALAQHRGHDAGEGDDPLEVVPARTTEWPGRQRPAKAGYTNATALTTGLEQGYSPLVGRVHISLLGGANREV